MYLVNVVSALEDKSVLSSILIPSLYVILVYFVNVVSALEDKSVGPISNHLPPQHEFVVERQKFVKKEKEAKYHVSLVHVMYVR